MHAEKMMDALREKLMRDFATSSGSFVSGRESMPLPGGWRSRPQNTRSSSSEPGNRLLSSENLASASTLLPQITKPATPIGRSCSYDDNRNRVSNYNLSPTSIARVEISWSLSSRCCYSRRFPRYCCQDLLRLRYRGCRLRPCIEG